MVQKCALYTAKYSNSLIPTFLPFNASHHSVCPLYIYLSKCTLIKLSSNCLNFWRCHFQWDILSNSSSWRSFRTWCPEAAQDWLLPVMTLSSLLGIFLQHPGISFAVLLCWVSCFLYLVSSLLVYSLVLVEQFLSVVTSPPAFQLPKFCCDCLYCSSHPWGLLPFKNFSFLNCSFGGVLGRSDIMYMHAVYSLLEAPSPL